MASFKSRMANFMMRNRHLMQGRWKREVFDMDTSIQDFRDLCEKGAAKYGKLPQGLTVKPEDIQGIKAEWLIPQNAPSEKVILYVHGGGYVSGSCSDHRGVVSKFAQNTSFTNFLYEYRLAPEHKFPAAVDDSVTAYKFLLENGYKPENILIAGESAGGGLTLALLLSLKDQKIPMPVAAVAISPWADLTCSGDSYRTKNEVSVAPLNSWFVFRNHYAGTTDLKEPLLSPLYGDLAGLPPIFINSGEDDELFDDGLRFYQKAVEAGVNARFRRGKGQVHCYPLLAPFFPEATEAMNEIVEFVKQHLS